MSVANREQPDQGKQVWVIIAHLVRPQGRHGEILARMLTDFPERFAMRKQLYLLASEMSRVPVREVALERHWMHKGRVVLKFAGVDSIHEAEALRGLFVAVPVSERAPLIDDSIYISDLIGCEVIDVASAFIGKVTNLDRESGLLIVQPTHGEEILVPFAKAYLVDIDVERKRIEMRLPSGLLDINAPITAEERQTLDNTDRDEHS